MDKNRQHQERTPGRRIAQPKPRLFNERRSGFDRRARVVGLNYTYIIPR